MQESTAETVTEPGGSVQESTAEIVTEPCNISEMTSQTSGKDIWKQRPKIIFSSTVLNTEEPVTFTENFHTKVNNPHTNVIVEPPDNIHIEQMEEDSAHFSEFTSINECQQEEQLTSSGLDNSVNS